MGCTSTITIMDMQMVKPQAAWLYQKIDFVLYIKTTSHMHSWIYLHIMIMEITTRAQRTIRASFHNTLQT
jgi:hypothetical protein